jgi:hypothetical protein
LGPNRGKGQPSVCAPVPKKRRAIGAAGGEMTSPQSIRTRSRSFRSDRRRRRSGATIRRIASLTAAWGAREADFRALVIRHQRSLVNPQARVSNSTHPSIRERLCRTASAR